MFDPPVGLILSELESWHMVMNSKHLQRIVCLIYGILFVQSIVAFVAAIFVRGKVVHLIWVDWVASSVRR